jgi:predicted GNAT superfamily acetyltransferase
MNFAKISQFEVVPWAASDTKSGTIWIDNIRLVTSDSGGNSRPTAIATQNKQLVNPGEQVALTGNTSWDSDGTISSYRWEPATGLSNPNIANPTFSSMTPGEHVFDLIVTDNDGAENRNIAQVCIRVLPDLSGQSITLYRDAALTDTNVGDDSLEVYVKLAATGGGSADDVDYTLCTVGSSDSYSDAYNDCDDIEIMLVETGPNTKTYTGMFKVGAFSDDVADRIGCAEGCRVTVTSSDALASDSFTVGRTHYGRWQWVDRFETDLWTPNHFEGFACAYNDHQYTNTTAAYVNYDATVSAHSNSTACAKADVTLHLGAAQDTYRLFGGIACTLNPFDETVTNFDAAVDLRPGETWTKGVSFWLKGNGKMLSVVLKSEAVTDYDDYVFTLPNTPTQWRRFFIPLSEFHQEGWGTAVDFETAMQSVEAVQFKASSKTDGEYSLFFVDDVAIFGGCMDIVQPLVHWDYSRFSNTNTFEGLVYNSSIGWTLWGDMGIGLSGLIHHYEGNACFMAANYTGAGYWLGALVPDMQADGLKQGEPNVTDWSNVDGVAVKVWRHVDPYEMYHMTNAVAPDGSPMRVRMVVSEDTNDYTFANAGVTRWYLVDSLLYDLDGDDFIYFPKEKFYTEASVDLVPSNDVLPWVEWEGDWSNIQKFRIEFGGTTDTALPHPVFLDDLRTYQDNGWYYPCPWE